MNYIFETLQLIYKLEQNDNKTLKISGPVYIGYYTSQKFNKKIILMGDRHDSKEGNCGPNYPSIAEYIDTLKSNKDININLFIEAFKPKKEDLKKGKVNVSENYKSYIDKNFDYLLELIMYADDNYKKYNNLKIHYIDIRNHLDDLVLIGVGNFYMNEQDYILNHDKEFFKNYETTNIYTNIIRDFKNDIKSLTLRKTKNTNKNYFTYEIVKELKKLKENNNSVYELISNYCINYIEKFLEAIDDDDFKNVEELYKMGRNSMAYIQDIYVLARIFKSDEYKNNIIYVGNFHAANINFLLQQLNIKPDLLKNADNTNYRCIEIKPFNKFFQSKK